LPRAAWLIALATLAMPAHRKKRRKSSLPEQLGYNIELEEAESIHPDHHLYHGHHHHHHVSIIGHH
jgi:hypothetical protein